MVLSMRGNVEFPRGQSCMVGAIQSTTSPRSLVLEIKSTRSLVCQRSIHAMAFSSRHAYLGEYVE